MRPNKLWKVILMLALTLTLLPTPHIARADTYTVTNTNDSGAGSLRSAIEQANTNPGPDIIEFDIAGCAGVCTIQPTSLLPLLTDDDTTIDGYSQPGASEADDGTPATLLIELDGSSIAGLSAGLVVTSTGNLIRGLVINRFSVNGIAIVGNEAMGNVVSGNYVGTDASGTVDLGNGADGVFVGQGAQANTVGGDTPAARNVLSGNGWEGVGIHGAGTMGNVVSGNYVGTDAAGTGALANTLYGVRIYGQAQNNTVGGDTAGERNVISGNDGNDQNGVHVVGSGTTGNVVSGNYIGTDASGTADLGNDGFGVYVGVGARDNLVGGSNASPGSACTGECNVISGNDRDGVYIVGSDTMSNTVSGNYVGTDASGTARLGNRWYGVCVGEGSQYNTVGGDTAGERNVISGNGDVGVGIQGSGTMSNTVSGNYVGTDASGAVDLGNDTDAVYISTGAQNNVIGGDTPGERNVLSGNGRSGVYITDEGTTGNVVLGNYVGVDASGAADLGNDSNGIGLYGDAQYTIIGGDTEGQRNVISGNSGDGIQIGNPAVAYNTIAGNYIGTDATGTARLGNDEHGIDIYNDTHDNTIGPGNVIAANGGHGLELSGRTYNHVIHANYVGTNAAGATTLGNVGHGIRIRFANWDNTIGPDNVIACNGGHGVTIEDDRTTGHTITRNSIFANDGGIDLVDGANGGIAAPVIVDTILGSVDVVGVACPGCTVEVFANGDTDGEGERYVGSADADGSGVFTVTAGSLAGPYLTATATDVVSGTSEFSAVFTSTVRFVYLPIVLNDS